MPRISLQLTRPVGYYTSLFLPSLSPSLTRAPAPAPTLNQ